MKMALFGSLLLIFSCPSSSPGIILINKREDIRSF